MALRIRCKSSLEYFGILVLAGNFGGGLEISESGGGEESGGAIEGATKGTTEGATEGAMEKRFRWGHPQPRIEIISELIFF